MSLFEWVFTWFALLGNIALFLEGILWLEDAWYDWTEKRALKRQKMAKISKSCKYARTIKR